MRTLGDTTALPEQPSWDDDPYLGDTLRTAAEEPGAEVTPGGNVLTGEFQHYTDEQITDMAQMSDYLSETYGQRAVVQFDGPNPHARGGHIGELDGTGRIHLRPEAWAQSDPGTSFVGNAAEDILTHEYGHLIERKFKTSHLYDGPDLEGLFRQATQPLTDVVQRENALFEQAREAARAAGRTLGVDDLPAYREVHRAAESVSMYGMTNRAEGFAELFLAHVSGRSNPYVDHFTEHLNEGLRQLGVR